jgi:hypothetical protein
MARRRTLISAHLELHMHLQSITRRGRRPTRTAWPELEEMDRFVAELRDGLVHASDRPEIEGRILSFLNHSNGPTTAGVAAEMRISLKAAAVHLSELQGANRVWSQPSHGSADTWHISLEGRHYLAQRGFLRGQFVERPVGSCPL